MITRRGATRPGKPLGAALASILLLSALGCTTSEHKPQPGQGGGGAPAVPEGGTTGGGSGTAGEAAGAGAGGEGGGGGSAGGSAGAGGTSPNAPDGGGGAGSAGGSSGAGGTPSGPIDASSPPDAEWTDAPPPPGCPPVIPEFDAYCNREGLSCQYGMFCCPDFAYCEFGRWTLLTHHCDACP